MARKMEPEDERSNVVSRGSQGLVPQYLSKESKAGQRMVRQVETGVQIFRQAHINNTGSRLSRKGESASKGQEQV